jgi:hypothetical protein
MTQASLDNLRDIHLPPPPGWWPPAPGWWVVAGVCALAAGLWLLRRHRRRAPLRAAVHELDGLAAAHARNPDPARLAAGLSRLLRRYAMWRFPQSGAAALTGEPWLRFLDQHGGDGNFARGPGALLATLPYQATGSATHHAPDTAGLIDAARRWLRANAP